MTITLPVLEQPLAIACIDGAIDCLVDVMTARAERELTNTFSRRSGKASLTQQRRSPSGLQLTTMQSAKTAPGSAPRAATQNPQSVSDVLMHELSEKS